MKLCEIKSSDDVDEAVYLTKTVSCSKIRDYMNKSLIPQKFFDITFLYLRFGVLMNNLLLVRHLITRDMNQRHSSNETARN